MEIYNVISVYMSNTIFCSLNKFESCFDNLATCISCNTGSCKCWFAMVYGVTCMVYCLRYVYGAPTVVWCIASIT